jgi:Ankyrin repeat
MANPKDLNEAYKRLYMDKAIQNERQNTAKTYRVILSAYEPLTIKQVAEAVSIGNDGEIQQHVNAEYIIRRCHNFIVENEDGFLEFAHQSARLFFEQAENHGDNNFVDVDDFSDTANHRETAKICLQLMLRPDHPMWLIGKLDSVQCSGKIEFPKMLPKIQQQREYAIFREWARRRGFSQYAFFYWADHCRKLGSTNALGQELSRELTSVIFGPKTTFSWWCQLIKSLGNIRWSHSLERFLFIFKKVDNGSRFWEIQSEVLLCMQHTGLESQNFSPQPLLAVCVWNFAECLNQPQVRDFLRVEQWPCKTFSPLHACCASGSDQAFAKLVQYQPEKVWELMFKASDNGLLPIELAVMNLRVNITRSFLRFERDRTKDQGCWSSRQLSSLHCLVGMVGWTAVEETTSENTTHMIRMLLKFEADQTGNHFPQREGERWISELVQRPTRDGYTLLELAVRYGDARAVSLLLQAGAKPSKTSRWTSALAAAFLRVDEQGSKIVELLLSEDPAVLDTITEDEFVSYLARASSLRAADSILKAGSTILKERPELAWERRRKDWITALRIAQGFHSQQLIQILEEARHKQERSWETIFRQDDKNEQSNSMRKGYQALDVGWDGRPIHFTGEAMTLDGIPLATVNESDSE